MTTLNLQLDPRGIRMMQCPPSLENVPLPLAPTILNKSSNQVKLDLASIAPNAREDYAAEALAEQLSSLNVGRRRFARQPNAQDDFEPAHSQSWVQNKATDPGDDSAIAQLIKRQDANKKTKKQKAKLRRREVRENPKDSLNNNKTMIQTKQAGISKAKHKRDRKKARKAEQQQQDHKKPLTNKQKRALELQSIPIPLSKPSWMTITDSTLFIHSNEKLSVQIDHCLNHITPTPSEYSTIQSLLPTIQTLLEPTFPNVTVTLAGSWHTNLALPTSSIDIIVHLNNPNTSESETYTQYRTVRSILTPSTNLSRLIDASFERMMQRPFELQTENDIVHLHDTLTNRPVQVFLEDTEQEQLDEMVAFYTARYGSNLISLVLLIKQHLHLYNLSFPHTSGLSGLATFCLVAAFMDISSQSIAPSSSLGITPPADANASLLMQFFEFFDRHNAPGRTKHYNMSKEALVYDHQTLHWTTLPRPRNVDHKDGVHEDIFIAHPLQNVSSSADLGMSSLKPVRNAAVDSTLAGKIFEVFWSCRVYHVEEMNCMAGLEKVMEGDWDGWEEERRGYRGKVEDDVDGISVGVEEMGIEYGRMDMEMEMEMASMEMDSGSPDFDGFMS